MFTPLFKIAAFSALTLFSTSATVSGQTTVVAQTSISVDQEPSATTATYGSWTVQCQRTEAENGSSKSICEMVQTLNLQQSGQMIMRVAIGRLPDSDDVTIVFQTRAGVMLRDPVTLAFGKAPGSQTLTATYSRCMNGFCFADTILTPEMVSALGSATTEQTAILSYTGSTNQGIQIPLALNGFAGAYREVMVTRK